MRYLQVISSIRQRHDVIGVALVAHDVGPLAWHAVEFGADQIVRSPLDLRWTARLLRRYAARVGSKAESQSPAESSFREQVRHRLPWKRHDTGGSG